MADDKDLERQYRKNLMVVASIVLIYSIAGGKMAPDLSLFGAKLQFSRPDWLEYAMVAVMCFFWWRHWQMSAATIRVVMSECYQSVVIPEHIEKQLYQVGKRNGSVSCYTPDGYRVSVSPKGDYEEICDEFTTSVYLLPYGRFKYFLYALSMDMTDKSLSQTIEMDIDNRMDRFHLFIITRWAIAKSWFMNPGFGDSILPSIASVASLLSWFINKFVLAVSWQSEWCADLFNRL